MADDVAKLFYGTGGVDECTEFVRSVRTHAFSEGKARDDEWVADYAATRMAGSVVIWFASLDEDVQGSWKFLCRALLDKYAAPNASLSPIVPTPAAASGPAGTSSLSSGSYSSILSVPADTAPRPSSTLNSSMHISPSAHKTTTTPTPGPSSDWLSNPFASPSGPSSGWLSNPFLRANPTPSPNAVRTGLLRIIGPGILGAAYVSRQIGFHPTNASILKLTKSRQDALEVSYETSPAGPTSLKIKNVTGGDYYIGVVWNNAPLNLARGSASYAALLSGKTASNGLIEPVGYPGSWRGPLLTRVWRMTRGSDGKLTVECEVGNDGTSSHILDTAFHLDGLTGNVYLYVDYEKQGHNFTSPGRLVLESV